MSTWPQYAAIFLYAWNLLIDAAKDGEPRTGNHSLSLRILATMVSVFILWKGGFWNPIL